MMRWLPYRATTTLLFQYISIVAFLMAAQASGKDKKDGVKRICGLFHLELFLFC